MDFRAEYEKWCTDPYFDEATKAELKAIAGDDKEIEDRFYRTLEFGTAGLRGVIGAGTNRMNIYTVRQATQGLANYILSQGEDAVKRGVAIAHDSRNMHDEFTDATALCLAANGIKTYVFPQLAPVPELSYAVRTLGTIAGVVITASHNPREYNGYKVYWEDGAQVTPPHDTSIMAEVAKVTSFDQVKTMDKAAAIEAGLYNVISDEVEDRFYRTLEFGTAGLRGVIGAGTNRMNIYTVRQATQGLANYILSQGEDAVKRGVAIAHDSRNMHDEFTDATALCLAANGIKTYVFPQLAPVPELSYAVRTLGTIAGVVITASHNPREYNGYKVYWEDGAQVTPPHDTSIMAEVAKVTSFDQVKTMDKAAAIEAGLYNVISDEVEEGYFGELRKLSIHPEIIKAMAKDIKIVYTPLHGTGLRPVQRVLKDMGFENVYIEPSQAVPDGNFPTCPYPNPENPDAWKLALELAKEKDADIVLATDPDADRLGVYCKDTKTGEYVTFTGNMSAMLIGEYILSQKSANGTLPEKPAFVESIVSTDMGKAIAAAYGVKHIEVLTGFKYIGEQMLKFEKTGCNNYVFGMEESYGCLPGTYARDKDAPAAVCMLCEVAAFYKSQGKTLWDGMIDMYEKYGYYREGISTLTLKGIDGAAQINEIMTKARAAEPKKFGDYQVLAIRDYKNDTRKDMTTGKVEPTGLPSSNVLYYELNDNAWCCVRPSGTEPKIKFYFGVKGVSLEDSQAKLDALSAEVLGQFE